MSHEATKVTSRPLAHSPNEKHDESELLYADNLVTIDIKDPAHPLGWPMGKRIVHTVAFGMTTFCAQFNASILAPAIPQISQEYNVGTEVGTLAMSIYIFGNGLGPMLFAPVSELYGRKIGVLIPYMISAFFMLVIANVQSIAAIVVFRFISGVFAAAPIVTSGAAMADMWKAEHRAAALVLYAVCIVAGSSYSPIFGQLLVDTGSYGWRWCCWLGGILGFFIGFVNFIFLSETYLPALNSQRARKLRLETGNWALHAKHDEWELTWKEFFLVHCARPVLMFLTPIVFLMASFASFAYGLMFLIITSVAEQFEKQKGFQGATKYLPLMCNFIGFLTGGLANVANSKRFAARLKARNGVLVPEDRLPAMMLLGWTLPAGCFIYAWTLRPSIHWIVPCVGIYLIGVGIAAIFQGALNYIVDCYTRYGASAIAANTLLRSIYGGAFPLFAHQLYATLGTAWAGSLMGFLGLILIPIPFVFAVYGAKARRINPFDHLIT